ncbi:putative phage head-tail adaptor [Escherichia coli]|nr:putative phage head-tail adaptor [Escherichia coli]
MAISAGRLTQMISVLNPVLTRNAAGEMTEEWVSWRENSCGYPGQEQPGADAVRWRKWRRRKSASGCAVSLVVKSRRRHDFMC